MISKELLKRILLEQQKRAETIKSCGFIEREKIKEIEEFIKLKHSIVITGIRRCGKSIFLSQISEKFFDKPYYINFEDERLAKFDLEDFDTLYETCIEILGDKKVFFLDEIQNIKGWERWVRRMYEDGFKFFITGSNARLLSKELATLLTGRHLQFSLFPFSFREFLKFQKFDFKEKDMYLSEKRSIIKKYLSEYLEKGGFPEYLKDNKIEILQEYFNDIIQRDVVERYGVEKMKEIKELGRFLLNNTGNLTNYTRISKFTKINSVNTVIKYISYLENAYLISIILLFSPSLKKQANNPFKVYAIDTGLRNAMSFRYTEDLGKNYETVVANELRIRGKDIYYWRNTHNEIDFVLKEGMQAGQLIQVCYDVSDLLVKEREISGLIKGAEELKCQNLLIITSEYEGEEKVNGKDIKFIPLWKWLLNY